MKRVTYMSASKMGLESNDSAISMAPLIDVVFLLLIFFMVTTVFPENRGLVIEKPQSEQAEHVAANNVQFSLDADGGIYFKDHAVSLSDIKRLVAEQLAVKPDTFVMLQVDRRVKTEALINLMDACKLGGAARVAIATKYHETT